MDDLSIEIELNRIKSKLLLDNWFVLTYRYNIFSDQGQRFQRPGNRYRQGKFTFTDRTFRLSFELWSNLILLFKVPLSI